MPPIPREDRGSETPLFQSYSAILDTMEGLEECPDKRAFESSFGFLRNRVEAERYERFVRNLAGLSRVALRDCRVLEAGCGYGLLSISLALLGAREVHGIELTAHRLRFVSQIRSVLPLNLPVSFSRGDVSQLPFRDNTMDLVLVVEAISHFAELDRFIADVRRVLVPGGTLLLSDGNNGANPLIRRRTEKYWAQLERGGRSEAATPEVERTPFVEVRANILRTELGMDPAAAREGALHTSGLRHPEILQAGRQYLSTGQWPNHTYRYGTCPMDPRSLQYEEMLFDPCNLGRRLEDFGFRCRILPHFGGEARGGIALLINRLLQQLPPYATKALARGFRIVAVKERRNSCT
jgi:2-polyprenyl-3-methyl-5-hydroxy-6-metoxy-1,4-benzoquinol methylase